MNPQSGIIMVSGDMEVDPLYSVHSQGEAWEILFSIINAMP